MDMDNMKHAEAHEVDSHRDEEILILNDSFKFLLDEPDLYDEVYKRLNTENEEYNHEN